MDNSNNEDGFLVERLNCKDNFYTSFRVGPNITSFQDTGLSPNTQYSYVVTAYNSTNLSNCTNTFSATTQTITIPATPSNLAASAATRDQINLSWSDNSTNETGFIIERSVSGGSFVKIATTVTNATSYQDISSLSQGTTYQYRICAYNGGGNSSYSGTVSATTHSNKALNKTASASSTYSSSYAASKGNDGNITTRWCASTTSVPQWWKVDLGSSRTLSGSEVMWQNSGVVYKYKIQTSTDNTNWTTRVDLSNNTNTAQTQYQSFSTTARYVRIYVTAVPSGSRASLFEFRVFGQ